MPGSRCRAAFIIKRKSSEENVTHKSATVRGTRAMPRAVFGSDHEQPAPQKVDGLANAVQAGT
eukprot:10319328-Heterocapsa_arctica.AAC.1